MSKAAKAKQEQEEAERLRSRKPCPLHTDDNYDREAPPTDPGGPCTDNKDKNFKCECSKYLKCDCQSKNVKKDKGKKKKDAKKRQSFHEIYSSAGENCFACCRLLGLYFKDVAKLILCVSNAAKPGYDTKLTELMSQMAKLSYALLKNLLSFFGYVYRLLFVIPDAKQEKGKCFNWIDKLKKD